MINTVPCTTWNWLKMNKDFVTLDATFTEVQAQYNQLPSGVTISSLKDSTINFPQIFSGICNDATPKAQDNRRQDGTFIDKAELQKQTLTATPNENHPVQKIINETVKTPQLITINGKIDTPIVFTFDFNESGISKQFIHIK